MEGFRAFVGLDVHKETISVAVADAGRVWTALSVQGVPGENSDLVRRRSCVRPVGAACGRWPRWVPRRTPKRACGLDGHHPSRVLCAIGSTDQHLLPYAPYTGGTDERP